MWNFIGGMSSRYSHIVKVIKCLWHRLVLPTFQALQMATFTFTEHCVIIRFLDLCGVTPSDIRCQISGTCRRDVMNRKNGRSWGLQLKDGRTLCDDEPKQPRQRWPNASRSVIVIAQVEQVEEVVMGKRLSIDCAGDCLSNRHFLEVSPCHPP